MKGDDRYGQKTEVFDESNGDSDLSLETDQCGITYLWQRSQSMDYDLRR